MDVKNILALRNFSFKFSADSKPFFHDVNLDFCAGKIHFIRGRNGAGKSVFLRVLQGVVAQREVVAGSVIFDGQTFMLAAGQSLPTAYTKNFGMICQKYDYQLADQFTFEQNLQLANVPTHPTLGGLPGATNYAGLLEHFAIDAQKPVHLLSGGQRQILAIIMMLQKKCRVLLLDEPTAALDDGNAALVFAFIQDLVASTGMTVFIISHDKELVETYATDGFYQITADDESGMRAIQFRALEL